MRYFWFLALCFLSGLHSSPSSLAEDMPRHGPLYNLSYGEFQTRLPPGTRLLVEAPAIERFLADLDETPPDWKAVFGHGHHDPEHDDRLFALNRERDAKRIGKDALSGLVTFAWLGVLSPFDQTLGGFSVSLGPKFVSTSWGLVRFKPEEAPGHLVLTPEGRDLAAIRQELEQEHHLEIEVLMTGRLVPDETLVYDFSHEEEGRGLIMPFVRVTRVDFLRRR
jgi:hypothetical protein